MELFIVLMIWLVCGFAGAGVSHQSKKTPGFMLGLVFGPLGVLIAAIAFKNP